MLSVLKGDHSLAETARRHGVSEQAIGNWKRQFLAGGAEAMSSGGTKASSREDQLEYENEELKAALGEAHVELRVWHRKIAAINRHDNSGAGVSDSAVGRVMTRNGLAQAVNYQAERRLLAPTRRACFVDPPTRRNRVWKSDFSEFETEGAGKWILGGLVDYWAKPNLACTVTTTQNANDLIGVFETAITAAEELLGYPLILDCVNADDIIEPIMIVTDNGGAMRSIGVARWFADRPHFVHVRTKVRSPGTNGVIERFFQPIKYEHLYRQIVGDGADLGVEVDAFRSLYNRVRPHESIGMDRPADRYLEEPVSTEIMATI
ncbi:MAG: putative transposase [Verrucomicrobiales bacterium]